MHTHSPWLVGAHLNDSRVRDMDGAQQTEMGVLRLEACVNARKEVCGRKTYWESLCAEVGSGDDACAHVYAVGERMRAGCSEFHTTTHLTTGPTEA